MQHSAVLTSSRLNAGTVGTDLLGLYERMQHLWMLQVTFAQQARCATRSHVLRFNSEFSSESAQSQRLAASVQRSEGGCRLEAARTKYELALQKTCGCSTVKCTAKAKHKATDKAKDKAKYGRLLVEARSPKGLACVTTDHHSTSP